MTWSRAARLRGGQVLAVAGAVAAALGIAAAGGGASAALAAAPATTGAPATTAAPATVTWGMGGQNLSDTRFQAAETKISRSTVSRLAPAWSLPTPGGVSATPAVVNGVAYVPDWGGDMTAVKAATGAVIWQHPVSEYTGISGDVARTDPVVDGNTLIIGTQAGADLIAINASTGARKWVVKLDTHPEAIITGSPVVYGGVVYVGVSSKEQTA